MNNVLSVLVTFILTAASGLMDARGFLYASKAWPDGQLALKPAVLSLVSFLAGVSLYIASVRFMQALGLQTVALQSAIWFVITAVGIAAMDGTVLQWTRSQQLVAIGIVVALTWLISSTNSTGH